MTHLERMPRFMVSLKRSVLRVRRELLEKERDAGCRRVEVDNYGDREQLLRWRMERPFLPSSAPCKAYPILAWEPTCLMRSISKIASCLSLILLIWNQVPGLQAHEFQFGSCRVEGVDLSELWEAFWAVKNTVQTQDDITSVQLLKPQIFQDVSDAESCYLAHRLLNFYLNTVFKNYLSKGAEFKILKSFSTLANNFIVIVSKLQPDKDLAMLSVSESAHQRFLLFHRAFKQMDKEGALVKAFGEVDILLTWMQKYYQP
ncbi:interleukin-24 [Sigmodon hispidus]